MRTLIPCYLHIDPQRAAVIAVDGSPESMSGDNDETKGSVEDNKAATQWVDRCTDGIGSGHPQIRCDIDNFESNQGGVVMI